MTEDKIGLLYLSLHNHLKKKFGYKPITKKDFFALLGRHFLIPKPLRIVIMKEMEERVLIEMIDRENLRAANIKRNIEEEASRFYKNAGLWQGAKHL